MKEAPGRMTTILQVELGPRHSPSHLACYDLGPEHQRCVRLPTPGSWSVPRKGTFLSSVPSAHAHTHTHTHTVRCERCEPAQLRSQWPALQWPPQAACGTC